MNQTTGGHSPEDFDWILIQFNNDNIEPIIVAGQAVNIWGKTFREWDTQYNSIRPKIEDLLPLTSNDMELLEFRGVSALGKFKGMVGGEKTDPFAKAAAPDTATYHLENKTGLFKVQILAWLPGASREQILKHLVSIKLGTREAHVKVPDPVVLLSCKIANLTTLKQTNPKRHDHRHVQILMCCIRAMIGQGIQNGTDTHDILKLIKRFNRVIQTNEAKKVAKKYGLNWNACIPFDLIEREAKNDTAWQNFYQHRQQS